MAYEDDMRTYAKTMAEDIYTRIDLFTQQALMRYFFIGIYPDHIGGQGLLIQLAHREVSMPESPVHAYGLRWTLELQDAVVKELQQLLLAKGWQMESDHGQPIPAPTLFGRLKKYLTQVRHPMAEEGSPHLQMFSCTRVKPVTGTVIQFPTRSA